MSAVSFAFTMMLLVLHTWYTYSNGLLGCRKVYLVRAYILQSTTFFVLMSNGIMLCLFHEKGSCFTIVQVKYLPGHCHAQLGVLYISYRRSFPEWRRVWRHRRHTGLAYIYIYTFLGGWTVGLPCIVSLTQSLKSDRTVLTMSALLYTWLYPTAAVVPLSVKQLGRGDEQREWYSFDCDTAVVVFSINPIYHYLHTSAPAPCLS